MNEKDQDPRPVWWAACFFPLLVATILTLCLISLWIVSYLNL